MNTQGIGLGLVISKMITEEFGGMAQMHSKYQHGSIFQSSFEVIGQKIQQETLASQYFNNQAMMSLRSCTNKKDKIRSMTNIPVRVQQELQVN